MSTEPPTGRPDAAAGNDHPDGADHADTAAEPSAPTEPSAPEADPGSDRGSGEVRAAGGDVGDEVSIADSVDRSRVRRVPRYGRFATLGGLLGVILAAVATPFADETEFLDYGGLFLLLTALLVPFCILIGCVIALLLDRRKK
ncbi:hypothetical protein [Ruania alba]|uniref:Uncharacterized protein n=1 Tax=Ruania alba TaxID=648782 RepID=A0A1H5KBQ2_9MICO|nr:hypothetical protein [Ruania alba]SEE62199.1 hypothetical protein SAMN04488554_2183 [Ruania alba]